MVAEVKKDICQEEIYTVTIPTIDSLIKGFIQCATVVCIIHLHGKAGQKPFKWLLFIHIGIYLAICGIWRPHKYLWPIFNYFSFSIVNAHY